ncbi:SDR family oxidoreductase [Sphingomonas sp. ASV193]|uniref:SDR family NAD(P)-dependent oxidoreductase n=1 Tax=Sphingomonas sp. ASV193 TaxID=3144405 RepID=UPI0032E90ABD
MARTPAARPKKAAPRPAAAKKAAPRKASLKPVAVITGASAGLGVDFARQLAADGHRLLLVARRKERLEALAAEVGNARALALDLGQPGAAAALVADLAAHGERVDMLVNNAGFGLWGRFTELGGARQREMIDLNVGTLVELCHAVLPEMVRRKEGAILNVASTAAFQPGPGMATYFATKAFVLSFTEALHEEVKANGVRVSALCPGPTATEFGAVAGFTGNGAFDKMSAKSEDVVTGGLKALAANKAVFVPGLANKLGAQGHRFLPRGVLRKVTALIKH